MRGAVVEVSVTRRATGSFLNKCYSPLCFRNWFGCALHFAISQFCINVCKVWLFLSNFSTKPNNNDYYWFLQNEKVVLFKIVATTSFVPQFEFVFCVNYFNRCPFVSIISFKKQTWYCMTSFKILNRKSSKSF